MRVDCSWMGLVPWWRPQTAAFPLLSSMWGHREKSAICNLEEDPLWALNLPEPWSWTLLSLKLWEIDVCCINHPVDGVLGFPGGSVVKNPLASPGDTEDVVWPLGQENHPEEEIATYSSILAWEIPWTQEPSGLQSMRSKIFGYNWACVHDGILSGQPEGTRTIKLSLISGIMCTCPSAWLCRTTCRSTPQWRTDEWAWNEWIPFKKRSNSREKVI